MREAPVISPQVAAALEEPVASPQVSPVSQSLVLMKARRAEELEYYIAW